MNTYFRASLVLPLILLGGILQAEVPPPPKLEPVPDVAPAVSDQDLEPEITIRNRGKDKVEEYRKNGRLYMVKVTPSVGRPYYLIDYQGHGSFVRRDSFDKGLVVPTWVLKTW